MNPFFANSRVNLLVIFSSSCSLYSLGLSLRPAFPPPNGTSTQAHLKVIRADKAFTSSRVTSSENRIPATFQTRLYYLWLFSSLYICYTLYYILHYISYLLFHYILFYNIYLISYLIYLIIF